MLYFNLNNTTIFLRQAMSRDPKNHYQETPKQIRQKILKFVSIPEQFAPYAREKGLLDNIEIDTNEPKK